MSQCTNCGAIIDTITGLDFDHGRNLCVHCARGIYGHSSESAHRPQCGNQNYQSPTYSTAQYYPQGPAFQQQPYPYYAQTQYAQQQKYAYPPQYEYPEPPYKRQQYQPVHFSNCVGHAGTKIAEILDMDGSVKLCSNCAKIVDEVRWTRAYGLK